VDKAGTEEQKTVAPGVEINPNKSVGTSISATTVYSANLYKR